MDKVFWKFLTVKMKIEGSVVEYGGLFTTNYEITSNVIIDVYHNHNVGIAW